MDKIQKGLAKLSLKGRRLIKNLFAKLSAGDFLGLDIQKLKGNQDIFRLRKGNLRLIFRKVNQKIFLLAIERRNEKTYRGF